MSRRKIVIIVAGALIAVAVFTVVLFAVVTDLTQPVVDTGDQFMAAIQKHDMNAAYAIFTTELRGKVGQSAFADIFEDANVASWSYASRSIRNGIGQLSGQATIDNQTYQFQLKFINRDGKWQLDGYNFNQ